MTSTAPLTVIALWLAFAVWLIVVEFASQVLAVQLPEADPYLFPAAALPTVLPSPAFRRGRSKMFQPGREIDPCETFITALSSRLRTQPVTLQWSPGCR